MKISMTRQDTTGKLCDTRALRSMQRIPFILITLAACMGLHTSVSAQAATDCRSSESVMCDLTNVEDVIRLGPSPWIVGSSLPGPTKQGPPLYVFNAQHRMAKPVMPQGIAVKFDRKTYAACPAPPDFTKFASHGLDYRAGKGSGGTLYVINHGGREAVEVFSVASMASEGNGPVFTWIGCVEAPKGFWPDAVAALPGQGMVVTSLWDPTDKDRVAKLVAGKPVGGLAEWHPGSGWKNVGPTAMSGPNGVIASPDGKYVFVALWSGRQIMKLERKTGVNRSAPVDMLADNLRWSADGTSILAGGQDARVEQSLACFEAPDVNCNVPFKVLRVNPRTLDSTELVASQVLKGMGAGTGAIDVGNHLWLTTFRGDRLVLAPLSAAR